MMMAVANAAFQRPRKLEQPDQYLATMMIATTMNAAIDPVFLTGALRRRPAES
jgi:hypothetical protein